MYRFFLNDTATPEISPLPLHDALPIWRKRLRRRAPGHWASVRPLRRRPASAPATRPRRAPNPEGPTGRRDRRRAGPSPSRSEEHTSELQSRQYLVCRLLLEKKKYINYL